MLAKKFRLKKNRHFQYVYKKGTSVQSRFLSLVFAKSKLPYKVGFSVSKKIGKSVVRSKVKRRMTEAFRQIQPNLPVLKHNLIFAAKSGIDVISQNNIKFEMERLLKKAKLTNV